MAISLTSSEIEAVSPSTPTSIKTPFWTLVASFGAISIGTLVLLGWAFEVESLKRIAPMLVAMNPLTAVCFILSGAALWELRRPHSTSSIASLCRVIGAIVALVGFLKLGELVFGWNLGIDRWLFSSRLEDAATGIPNRMAPNTAFNFLCLGLALPLLDVSWKRVFPAQVLASIIFLASMLAVLGYAYGTKSFYGVGSFIPMAVHTALTFLLLVVGILSARPESGLIEALNSPSQSGATARRLLPAALVVPAILGWLRLKGQQLGLFDNELGVSLMVVASMIIFGVVVLWNARWLWISERERERVEEERNRATQALAQTNADLARHNAHMQSDLNLAREIQIAFLPQQYITFPRAGSAVEDTLNFYHRYEPNTTLGGDFSDVLLISDTQAGVLICDVMGHGVRSALVTAIVRGLAEELMSVAHDPGLFLTGINRSLLAILKRTSTPLFATSFYMVADLQRGELLYAGAGHPQPLLLRRGTPHTVPTLLNTPPEPALGVFDDAVYTTSQCALCPGDLLLLYTDGLTEVSNTEGEEWEEQGLLQAMQSHTSLPTDQLLDNIIADARQFSSCGQFEDDVCLVAMEVDRRVGT
ncbi:phosphoserine phosphatase RsbP [Abditibacteriota bacterium]|nr:phosphoserine phosphatase RsbP [Abditibacteriota bacterium]